MRIQYWMVVVSLSMVSVCNAEIVIPIEIKGGNPIAIARVNGLQLQLVIDSGGGLLALKSAVLAKLSVSPAATRSVTDAQGNTSDVRTYLVDSLELGGRTFTQLEANELGAYGQNMPGEGSIGRKLLNQFIARYDYAGRTIALYSSDERQAAKAACSGTEVETMSTDDDVIVSIAGTDQQSMRMLWDTGATYTFVKKSFADQHALPRTEPFYTSQRFELGAHDFGPLRFVVLDLKAPADVDGYIGSNFFSTHVVCIDSQTKKIAVRKH